MKSTASKRGLSCSYKERRHYRHNLLGAAKICDADIWQGLWICNRGERPLQEKIGWLDVSIADSEAMALLQNTQGGMDDSRSLRFCQVAPFSEQLLEISAVADLCHDAERAVILHFQMQSLEDGRKRRLGTALLPILMLAKMLP